MSVKVDVAGPRERPYVPRIDPPMAVEEAKAPKRESRVELKSHIDRSKMDSGAGENGKTRYEEIMSYLGDIEEEFS